MAVSDELRQDAEELERATGLIVEVVEAGAQVLVIIRQAPLPRGAYRLDATDILFITDGQYRLSAIDMFYTEVDVVKPDGSTPQGAESLETHAGRTWRRFSWHRNGVWNPARNGLLDHFEFMQDRFAKDAP